MTRVAGWRWFVAGCAVTAIFGAAHLASYIAGATGAAQPPAELAGLYSEMGRTRVPLAGLNPTMLGIAEYFSLSFSLLLFGLAAASFEAGRTGAGDPRRLARFAIINLVSLSALLAASVFYRIVPGIVSCGCSGALFGVSLIRSLSAPRLQRDGLSRSSRPSRS